MIALKNSDYRSTKLQVTVPQVTVLTVVRKVQDPEERLYVKFFSVSSSLISPGQNSKGSQVPGE